MISGSCCGGVITGGCCGGVITSPEKSDEKKKPEGGKKKPDNPDDEKISSDAPARIVVQLPADAKLTIDGVATKSTSAVRTFESPALKAGRAYSYVLEAKFTKDGDEVVVSKKIQVTPGKTTNVDMNKGNAVASK